MDMLCYKLAKYYSVRIPVIFLYVSAVWRRHFPPQMIIGIVVAYINQPSIDAVMNILYSPLASIHGVKTKTIIMENALRQKATGTRALPTTSVEYFLSKDLFQYP